MPVLDPAYEPSKAEESSMNYAQKQADAFKAADVLVLTMPMWGYAVPGVMKAWMDQVLSPGLTFTIDADGIKPLHNITSLILLVASGDVYKEEDARDALTPQVRAAFGAIGINDIRIAWADGQNPLFYSDGEVRRETAFEAAEELAEELAEEGAEG
jgi:FMN-dependent NADH-azoreductase